MLNTAANRRLGLVGTLIVSALTLFALAFPLSPAKAQCAGIDLGFGCAGLGVGSWYIPRAYYYGYPPPYAYPYYGAPAYSYTPAGAYPYYGGPAYSYTPAGRPDYSPE
jgi:hypothetical protein